MVDNSTKHLIFNRDSLTEIGMGRAFLGKGGARNRWIFNAYPIFHRINNLTSIIILPPSHIPHPAQFPNQIKSKPKTKKTNNPQKKSKKAETTFSLLCCGKKNPTFERQAGDVWSDFGSEKCWMRKVFIHAIGKKKKKKKKKGRKL